MFHDTLLQKALQMRRAAQCFPVETILKATIWLAEKHRQSPHRRSAIVIALQYLVLAMRPESQGDPDIAKEYLRQAVLWRKEANCRLSERSLVTEDGRQNQ